VKRIRLMIVIAASITNWIIEKRPIDRALHERRRALDPKLTGIIFTDPVHKDPLMRMLKAFACVHTIDG